MVDEVLVDILFDVDIFFHFHSVIITGLKFYLRMPHNLICYPFIIYLFKMNTQSLQTLYTQLQTHKHNEKYYQQKLKELAQTRRDIREEFDLLQKQYDKKVKDLEVQLENIRQANQQLHKQNILFKTEIGNYQHRLVQKEKIIAVLLEQKVEYQQGIGYNHSDKSKSSQTDSFKNGHQDQKMFKKHSLPPKQDDTQQQPTRYLNKNEHQQPELKHKQEEKEVRNEQNIKDSPKTQKADHKTNHAQASKERQTQNSEGAIVHLGQPTKDDKNVQEPEHNPVKKAPLPPPHKTHKKKAAKRPSPATHANIYQEEQTEEPAVLNYFQTNQPQPQSQQSYQPQLHVPEEEQPTIQVEVENGQEDLGNVVQESSPADFFGAMSSQAQHINESQQEYYKTGSYQIDDQHQAQQAQTVQPTQQNNNLLSHFTQSQQVSVSMEIKPKAHTKRPKKQPKIAKQKDFVVQSMQSSDFFNQLSKNEHPVANSLEIQESSIDHIDRDSLISNQQPYFAEESQPAPLKQQVKAKPIKMTKKKAKRDQIKVADPSLFA